MSTTKTNSTNDYYTYNNMPEHVRKNFLYRKCYRDIWIRKKNVGFVVTGGTGSGKSEYSLKLAHDLDPSFNCDRVVYTAEDFLKLLMEGDKNGKLGIGKAVVFDETSHDEAMDSRSSLSNTNKQMAALSTIYRALRLIVIYVAPNLNQIDSRVRAISITGLFQMKSIDYKREVSKADFFWSVQNSRTGMVYYKRPRVFDDEGNKLICKTIALRRPPKWLRLEYERKKMRFIKDKIARWYEKNKAEEAKPEQKKMTFAEMVADATKIKKSLMLKGKVNSAKIMQRYDIADRTASKIASLLNNS